MKEKKQNSPVNLLLITYTTSTVQHNSHAMQFHTEGEISQLLHTIKLKGLPSTLTDSCSDDKISLLFDFFNSWFEVYWGRQKQVRTNSTYQLHSLLPNLLFLAN